jgi:uncharacterized protein YceH (UPF0502 family)
LGCYRDGVEYSLTPAEIRVLGALIEKENTVPETYPLSLNGLLVACNQKTSRYPVVEYQESDVFQAIDGLRHLGFAAEITGGSRVAKYAQRFTEKLNLGRRETAILCVLLLRGQQTLGEIKGRTERIYSFSDLEEVETVMNKLAHREEGALVQKFAPSPGMKEARYGQTLGGFQEAAFAEAPTPASHGGSGLSDRVASLEAELIELRREVSELRARLESVL